MLPERPPREGAVGYNRRPMLWLKALHVVFVVTWFAGLFYLPRLFVYHVATTDAPGVARFIVMERRLYFIMSLGALLAVLVGYHGWCYRVMLDFRAGVSRHTQRWYRLFNEVPGLLLLAIVILAVVKP